MTGTMDILIREMTITDHDQVYGLWTEIRGFGIRGINGSQDGVEQFLRGNPATNVVAVQNGHVTGDILCGHNGRIGYFYHMYVAPGYRKHGIGCRMVRFVMGALQREGVSKISLIALERGEMGNAFWQEIG